MKPHNFFRKRFNIKKANLPDMDGAQLLRALIQRVRAANDLYFKKPNHQEGHYSFDELLPLLIEYGNGEKETATGLLKPPFAKEMEEAGFLKRTGKLLKLNIPDVAEGQLPTRDQVNTHFRKIEHWLLDKGYIDGTREPVHMTDRFDERRKDQLAHYDRNVDMFGLGIDSVGIIIELTDGPNKGCVVVARRHDNFVERREDKRRDSQFDIASGAITARCTRDETHASELLDEFNLQGDVLARIRTLDTGQMDTITTARYRGENGIVRERMRVAVLGITQEEFERLSCNDAKLVDGKRTITNVGYYAVTPQEMAKLLSTKDYLKNAKAVAMIYYLLKKGHLKSMVPSTRWLNANLNMRPTHRFSVSVGKWQPQRQTGVRRRIIQSIFAAR